MEQSIRNLLIVSIILLFCGYEAAGQFVVRGTVTEKGNDMSLIGVTVVEYDENGRILKGSITDPNGNFTIKASGPDAELHFSYVGYDSKTVPVNGRSQISVELVPASTEIEEVVVTAETESDPLTGVSLRDRTTATSKVNMDDLQDISSVSVDGALQGQVSGLDIMSSGSPGSGSSIVIRGLGSLGNSNPLIVVNGIAQNITPDPDFNFAGSDQEDIGQLLNIAPQDIKSIEVLKDAASTAVWGSKGADGVLLIETYRGEQGETKFNYRYKYTHKREPAPIPMLNGDEYITMQLEEWHNAQGIFEVPDEIAYNTDFVDFYNYSANTDWIDAVTQPGLSHDHYFKASGGGEKTAFFVSLNAANETGTTINEGFDRLTTRINLDYELSKDLKFTVFFDYTNSHRDGNYMFRFDIDNDNRNDRVNLRRMAYMKAPNMSIWERDETGELTGEYFTPIESYQGRGDLYFNPVAIGNLSDNDMDKNIFQNSYQINYRITSWMRFIETISFQYDNQKNFTFLPYTAIGTDWLDGEVNQAGETQKNSSRISSRSQLILTPIVTSVHSLTMTLLGQISQNQSRFSRFVSRNGPSLQITDPSAAPQIAGMNSRSFDRRSVGSMFSVNYKYRDKYLLSAIVRGDASSSFGENRRWGVFPSFSVGWRFSNEPFLQEMNFINNGMLRAGYGQTGKEPRNPYDRFGLFENANPSQYIFNDVIIPTQIELSNLKWQTVESWNLGLELAMFKRRVNISADVYNKVTKDILWRNYDIPSSSGFNRLAWFNGGQLQNQGWEASVRITAIRMEELRVSLNFNIARNRNSFLEFPDNFNKLVGTDIGNGVYPRMAQIGQPIGSFYGFNYLGVYSTPEDAYARDAEGNVRLDANGDPIPMRYANGYEFTAGDAIYEDVNKDGVIDLNDVVYLGDSNPDYTGGFGINTKWRQFSVSAHFLYRTGFDIVNEIASQTEGMLDKNNQSKAVLSRWRKVGDDFEGMLPRAYLDHPANNLGSSRYVESGSFLRLNNLSISYTFDPSVASKLRVDNLELGANLRKIWTLTGYTGQDPEISQRIGDDPFWFGTDNGMTPPPMVFSGFLNLSF